MVQAHALAIHPNGGVYLTGETAGRSPAMPEPDRSVGA